MTEGGLLKVTLPWEIRLAEETWSIFVLPHFCLLHSQHWLVCGFGNYVGQRKFRLVPFFHVLRYMALISHGRWEIFLWSEWKMYHGGRATGGRSSEPRKAEVDRKSSDINPTARLFLKNNSKKYQIKIDSSVGSGTVSRRKSWWGKSQYVGEARMHKIKC